MKICLDARELREVKTGLGRYALNLVRQIAAVDGENDYIVLRRRSYHEPLVDAENFREIPVPFGISATRNQLIGARIINRIDADIYHALYHFLPIGVRARKIVITLHDLIWIEHAALATESHLKQWLKRLRGGPLIGRALRRADHVVAISDATRRAAMSRFSFPAEKFSVIHHGVDTAFLGPAEAPPPDVCRGKRFAFSLGTSTPYKNLPRLFQAFARVAADFPDLFLLVTGRGDTYASLSRLTRDLDLCDRVIFTGQLSDAEIAGCFRHAVFFAFPSIVEGFGLPMLEAMACGCPVLTSNTSSLAEISNGAALCVDPLEVEALAAGMRQLLTDDDLRRRLAAKGLKRSEGFTWRSCGEKTLAVYRQVLSAPA